jgi:hypothetical protein
MTMGIDTKRCPDCKEVFERKVFGYNRGNGGENRIKAYCPACYKKRNDALNQRAKLRRDPLYCGF